MKKSDIKRSKSEHASYTLDFEVDGHIQVNEYNYYAILFAFLNTSPLSEKGSTLSETKHSFLT